MWGRTRPSARLLRMALVGATQEVHFLKACVDHLLANDFLHVAQHDVTQGKPSEDAWCNAPHVARANWEAVTRNLRIGGVITQGSKEQGGHAQQHR